MTKGGRGTNLPDDDQVIPPVGLRPRSHVWFRWFNEIPVLLLLAAVLLVVVKPF